MTSEVMAPAGARRHPRVMATLTLSTPGTAVVVVAALFFAGMGLVALARPAMIWAPFGVAPSTPAARNEVRAVYGGFGIAIAALLVAALGVDGDIREGILLAVATALGGMALGRVVGFAVERPDGWFPAPFFLAVESAAAVGLLLAARG